jgi:dolichyl-phosphate beta-glucosyltransferase
MSGDKEQKDKVEAWLGRQTTQAQETELSIVIPAFNEQWRLPGTLIDIIDYLDQRTLPFSYEIIIVDDGSNDDTVQVVRKFERIRASIRLLRLSKNFGKGHAVKSGVLNARGQKILFADADGATPISELKRLEEAIDSGAQIAIGSRAMDSVDTRVRTSFFRKYLGRTFNLFVNAFLLRDYADTQCGFKLFTRKAARFVFERQRANGFSFDLELLLIAQKAQIKVKEVPVNWENVPGSKVNVIIDGTRMFFDIFKFRFRHRHVDKFWPK